MILEFSDEFENFGKEYRISTVVWNNHGVIEHKIKNKFESKAFYLLS
jgi:hypothetical protein